LPGGLQRAILGAVNHPLVAGGAAFAAFVDCFEYAHGVRTLKAGAPDGESICVKQC
jgi:hypothetical protein